MESPGKFDSRTLSRETLSRWTGRNRRRVREPAADTPGFRPRVVRGHTRLQHTAASGGEACGLQYVTHNCSGDRSLARAHPTISI